VPPAWNAPAAAQDPRPVRAQEAKVLPNQDLYVPQDTVPVIRCCVQPPAGLTFWAPLDGQYTAIVPGLPVSASGAVSWTSPPPGHTGSALSLQASGRVDYPATSPATSLGTGDFTVDAWIRLPLPITQSVNPLLDNRVVTSTSILGFQLFALNGRIGFQMADGPWSNFIAPTPVSGNVWHLVAVTVKRNSPTGGRIWVDGNLVYTFNPMQRSGSLGTGNRLVIGHDLNNVYGQGAAFDIDEVEIFRRALTQAEVVALYRYPKCRPMARP
jgi:hypothetical protein